LPKGVTEIFPWLSLETPIEVLAGRGARGGLRLYSPEQRDQITAAMRQVADSAGDPDQLDVDMARSLGMTWEIRIEAGGRLILPEPARKLGLAPSAPGVGVVFAYGAILEIWRLRAWERFFEKHGPRLQDPLGVL
jgi:DNA-binding transcriptional regulator/RsmH inhibitor MraZ